QMGHIPEQFAPADATRSENGQRRYVRGNIRPPRMMGAGPEDCARDHLGPALGRSSYRLWISVCDPRDRRARVAWGETGIGLLSWRPKTRTRFAVLPQ